jgi:hypothetical protein
MSAKSDNSTFFHLHVKKEEQIFTTALDALLEIFAKPGDDTNTRRWLRSELTNIIPVLANEFEKDRLVSARDKISEQIKDLELLIKQDKTTYESEKDLMREKQAVMMAKEREKRRRNGTLR